MSSNFFNSIYHQGTGDHFPIFENRLIFYMNLRSFDDMEGKRHSQGWDGLEISWITSGIASIFRFCIWIFLQVRSSKNLKSLILWEFLSLFLWVRSKICFTQIWQSCLRSDQYPAQPQRLFPKNFKWLMISVKWL